MSLLDQLGESSHCWCQFHRCSADLWSSRETRDNREALVNLVRDGREPGLLTLSGERAVGWAAVAPLAELDRLTASPFLPQLRPDCDDLDTRWSITCFVVLAQARGTGLVRQLVAESVTFARSRGATSIEAYPVDVTTQAPQLSERLYSGTLPVFLSAGFVEVARLGPYNALVVRQPA
ncbi:GNAT family N-acetyltransferase [Nocardioides piscis]|uniref:GNAT family N-acetyltransferase n=1 Tax=Nocardioides piscis TaxID=2714938 RepID=A0A6G7YH41_9ACTN|nr:GNAT family N-acetyltransferase [Nocardioides piscis]QIK76135.1 GNAT family N-acetyltransferase [Nocardioides piscis]